MFYFVIPLITNSAANSFPVFNKTVKLYAQLFSRMPSINTSGSEGNTLNAAIEIINLGSFGFCDIIFTKFFFVLFKVFQRLSKWIVFSTFLFLPGYD